MKAKALIIDGESATQRALLLSLGKIGCSVATVDGARRAVAAMDEESFDVVFLDADLVSEPDLGVLSQIVAKQPRASVVVLMPPATVEAALDAMRRGAADCLPKPFADAQLEAVVDRLACPRGLAEEAPAVGRDADALQAIDLTTTSPCTRAMLDLVQRSAPSEAPILIRGESGTGKGVIARLIHARSSRSGGPFVVVNCPTLSKELMASELFGHARGSFTGAVRDQPGRVEDAAGGTLFLDEISEIPPGLQAKLLRFLQDGNFERVGETSTRCADARIVAATNRDLAAAVAAGTFREDLFYRLNVIEITIPPLRERLEDVSRLARSLIATLSAQSGRRPPTLAPSADQLLLSYDWPGNIRQLRNVLERTLLLCPTDVLDRDDFSSCIPLTSAPQHRLGEDVPLHVIEREHVEGVVGHAPSLEVAAGILAIDESTLRRKLRQYRGRGGGSVEGPIEQRHSGRQRPITRQRGNPCKVPFA
jgi:NtrC-family two-component system response regulator AlgB